MYLCGLCDGCLLNNQTVLSVNRRALFVLFQTVWVTDPKTTPGFRDAPAQHVVALMAMICSSASVQSRVQRKADKLLGVLP